MANDSANCDLQHFNKLAEVFGIRFTDKSINMVKNDVFEQGAVLPGSNNPIFKTTKKMYLKEVSALELHSPKNANAIRMEM
jgi:unsaturated rhamnogalacturonyl hydrolase